MPRPIRSGSATSTAALVVALLALLMATAGVGYTAATIGTGDIKNDAVTTAKIKDGTVKNADLVKDTKFKYFGANGAPNFSNGGQGDCIWQSGHNSILPGIARAGYRVDRFGTVHLSGIVLGTNGAGGDATCDTSETEDGIIVKLPADARPAKNLLSIQGSGSLLIIVGKNGLSVPGATLPPGAIYWGDAPSGVLLDSVSFPSASSKVYGRTTTGTFQRTPEGRAMLRQLGLGR